MPECTYQLAVKALAQAQYRSAITLFTTSCQATPNDPRSWIGLGASYCRTGEIDLALRAFQQAIMLQPDNLDIAFSIASTLQESGQNRLAESVYRNILHACPDDLPAAHNLGTLLYAEERFQAAIEQHQSTLLLHPASLATRRDLAQAQIAAGDIAAGIEQLETALQLAQSNAGQTSAEDVQLCKFTLGLAYLRQENWQKGWPLYEQRWTPAEWQALTECWGSPWDGSSLQGKRLLILAEQGHGDCLMFGRYLADLADEALHLEVLLPTPLLALFSNSLSCKTNVHFSSSASQKEHDYFVKMGSLPHHGLHPERQRLHRRPPPPLATKAEVSRSSHTLLATTFRQQTGRPCCGLVWRGQKNYSADNKRSLSLENLLSTLPFGAFNFVSLQIDATTAEKELLTNVGIIDLSDAINDFQDTANLIAQLAAVLSVDTATAHLAASLGKPLLLLQRQEREWRWGCESNRNPWYERCFSIGIKQGKPETTHMGITALLEQLIN